MLRRNGADTAEKAEDKTTDKGDMICLFTAPTCPRCKMAKMFLEKAGIAYQAYDCFENQDLVAEYGITQSPTLVVVSNGKMTKFDDISAIRKYIEEEKNV